MAIEVAAHAGFCMGVRRAVEAAQRVADEGKPSCTLGELIHNPQVVEMLALRGVPPVSSAQQAQGRQVLIRSHGVAPQVLAELEDAGCEVLDLTCPFVDRLHRIVRDESSADCPAILVGEREHPEVKGTSGWAKGPVYVVASPEEAVDIRKQIQICKVAMFYLAFHHLPVTTPCRFDVIAICDKQLHWIPNAFPYRSERN